MVLDTHDYLRIYLKKHHVFNTLGPTSCSSILRLCLYSQVWLEAMYFIPT